MSRLLRALSGLKYGISARIPKFLQNNHDRPCALVTHALLLRAVRWLAAREPNRWLAGMSSPPKVPATPPGTFKETASAAAPPPLIAGVIGPAASASVATRFSLRFDGVGPPCGSVRPRGWRNGGASSGRRRRRSNEASRPRGRAGRRTPC